MYWTVRTNIFYLIEDIELARQLMAIQIGIDQVGVEIEIVPPVPLIGKQTAWLFQVLLGTLGINFWKLLLMNKPPY